MAARRPTRAGKQQISLVIDRLGAQGDGLASHDGARVYVPGALPGEHVRARLFGPLRDGMAAALVAVETVSVARVDPPCPHFGICGGCALQHMALLDYHAWKRERVHEALRRRGFTDPPVAETVAIGAHSRRRASLVAEKRGRRAVVGFHRRRSDDPVDIETCVVIEPALAELIRTLRHALPDLLDHDGRVGLRVQMTETGIDLLIRAKREPTLDERQDLAGFAEHANLARLSWQHGDHLEPVAWRRPVLVRFGGVEVAPPPGAFLQASKAGETAIVDAMLAGLNSVQRVADLFAGCGSLSFPVARRARVHSVDADQDSLDALDAAARAVGGSRVSVERRDLFSRPLEPHELRPYDAVVFDPPRAGARAQAERLAVSEVPVVVAVSCEPATFARDARILVDGGYALEVVTPIDQFLWSAAVELVAVFRRDAARTTSRPRRR